MLSSVSLIKYFIKIVLQVHGTNSYDCEVCGAQFKSKEGLAVHKKKKHSASKSVNTNNTKEFNVKP